MSQVVNMGPAQAFDIMSAQELLCMYLEHSLRGEPPSAWVVDADSTTVWRHRHG